MKPRPIYTAHQHRPGVIKVESRDRVLCDCINDMPTAERIAEALTVLDGASAEDIEAVRILLVMRRGMRKIDAA